MCSKAVFIRIHSLDSRTVSDYTKYKVKGRSFMRRGNGSVDVKNDESDFLTFHATEERRVVGLLCRVCILR